MAFTAWLLTSWRRDGPGGWMIIAAAATALWTASVAAADVASGPHALAVSPLETLRTGAWCVLLARLLAGYWEQSGQLGVARVTAWIIGVLGVSLLGLDFLSLGGVFQDEESLALSAKLHTMARLMLAVGGLLLVENFYRNTAPNNRWGIRFFSLGMAAMFVYDFALYAHGLLLRSIDPDLQLARGAVNTLIVPLLAVSAARNPDWKLDVFVSRSVVFHSVSVVAAGVYLLVMALAGYYLREVGGDWGALLQVTFVFGASLVLILALFSGRFRAQARVLLNKHFFNYKYDYRDEWLRCIATVSTAEFGAALKERIIKAVCDIMESPGGSLWMTKDPGLYRPTARWNLRGVSGEEPANSQLISYLSDQQWVVDLHRLAEGDEVYGTLRLPAWASADKRLWLAVPLVHHDELLGFFVLQKSRAGIALNWEDYDLLKTVGRQMASYIAEQSAEKMLADARQFEAFNRRFAFVMHDLKNLVSQLALVVKNSEKHAQNPEFQADMLTTVRDSLDKMKLLLSRLSTQTEHGANAEDIELNGLLEELVHRLGDGRSALSLNGNSSVWVTAEQEKLEAVFNHLIQNALEAIDQNGQVTVDLQTDDDIARIIVSDDGCGMDEEFIENGLFQPFKSTKATGYGIGAYESRQIVEEYGGRIDVESKLGKGSKFTVLLPLSERSMVQSRDRAAALA
ncbi:MAG: PEP-CTERM system histidine kinase PrsK [Sphingomonadales bacterium]|nr:PEP-CTERM system histidine kinase PrsK [Sphingomonadales bacterium]